MLEPLEFAALMELINRTTQSAEALYEIFLDEAERLRGFPKSHS